MKDFYPILSCDEAAEFEKKILGNSKDAAWRAMSLVGEKIADSVISEFGGFIGSHSRILCLCGRGHNGGDALLLAKKLVYEYPFSELFVLSDSPESMRPNTRRALGELLSGVSADRIYRLDWSQTGKISATKFDLLIEGLAGMSFVPPLRDDLRSRIEFANSLKCRLKISVDIPAGIGDEKKNSYVFAADATYAAGIAKTPLFRDFNSEFVGRVRFADAFFFNGGCGADNRLAETAIAAPSILSSLNSPRPAICDKRTFGHLFILAGSKSYPGTALMNVRAALRSGVGLVTAFVPEQFAAQFAAVEPSAIWVACDTDESGAISLENYSDIARRMSRCDAFAVGSGITDSRETRALLANLLREFPDKPFVLDADAVCVELASLLSPRGAVSIMTPHAGEFLRLASDISDFSLKSVSGKYKSVVLLKGSISRASDGNVVARLLSGSPALARGGSGDILCGLCGGLFARSARRGVTDCEGALRAACAASEWLGLAGRKAAARLSENSLSSSDIIAAISECVADF